MTDGNGLLIVQMDVDPVIEPEFRRWYDEEHIPELLSIPGFLRARRFEVVEGGPKFLVTYDLANVDVLKSREYLELPVTDIRQRMRAQFRNASRGIYRNLVTVVRE